MRSGCSRRSACSQEAARFRRPRPSATANGPSPAVRLGVGVRRFWQIHGYLVEGRQALESALAATPDGPSELRANALNMSGILAGEQGEFDAARASFQAALADARAVGSTRVI